MECKKSFRVDSQGSQKLHYLVQERKMTTIFKQYLCVFMYFKNEQNFTKLKKTVFYLAYNLVKNKFVLFERTYCIQTRSV